MSAQPLFMPGETSPDVNALLEHIQSTHPDLLDIDEDNVGQNWGHYQFTAGGLTLSSSLTTWHDIGSVETALKLVAGALKICQEARRMCAPGTSNFISDVYLSNTLEHLENCWVGAGGVRTHRPHISRVLTVSRQLLPRPTPCAPTRVSEHSL